MQAIGCQDVVLFALPNANKQTNNMSKQNKDVGMGKYERVSAGRVSILHRIAWVDQSWNARSIMPFLSDSKAGRRANGNSYGHETLYTCVLQLPRDT